MSAAAPVPATATMRCSICEVAITRMQDAQKVKDRGAPPGAVRCMDYAGCMVRSAKNRRDEIGARL